jgi:hypothetical protein
MTIEECSKTGLRDAAQAEKNLALIRDSHDECKRGAVVRRGKLICITQKAA